MNREQWKKEHAEDIYYRPFTREPIKFKDLSEDRQYHIACCEVKKINKNI